MEYRLALMRCRNLPFQRLPRQNPIRTFFERQSIYAYWYAEYRLPISWFKISFV
jgi:hypothetical protein